MSPTITEDVKDELILSCRYGDLEEVQAFVKEYTADVLPEIRDDNGNCVLHMISANGHLGEKFLPETIITI